jgi:hypothetical protein
LVPEAFYMPEMFRNDQCFDLGVKQTGEPVTDVEVKKIKRCIGVFFVLKHTQKK